MKHCRFLIIGLFIALFSCVNENIAETPLNNKQEEQQNKLSLDEARAEVENMLSLIDNTTRTNGKQRKITDYYYVVQQNATRSDSKFEEELITYIFNFENNNGYAIIAADKRIASPILALTTRGTIGTENYYQFDIDMVYGVRI